MFAVQYERNKINKFQTGTIKIGEAERGWGQKHFELAP